MTSTILSLVLSFVVQPDFWRLQGQWEERLTQPIPPATLTFIGPLLVAAAEETQEVYIFRILPNNKMQYCVPDVGFLFFGSSTEACRLNGDEFVREMSERRTWTFRRMKSK